MAEEVLPPLFSLAGADGLPTTTLAEFSAWWARREAVDMRAEFDPQSGELHISFHGEDELPGDLPVEIFTGERDVDVRVGEHSYSAPAGSRLLVGASSTNVIAGAKGERSC
jgi:hypothetical protein